MGFEQRFDDDDIESAATCAFKEARGDGDEGMGAVLHVLKHRVGEAGFGKTLHDVIYGKNQFSSMSVPSDPEFNLVPDEEDPAAMKRARVLALDVLRGVPESDPTGGALYYANLHQVSTDGWFYKNIMLNQSHPITAQIGHHTFFA